VTAIHQNSRDLKSDYGLVIYKLSNRVQLKLHPLFVFCDFTVVNEETFSGSKIYRHPENVHRILRTWSEGG
jgi:hypothetical protein